MVAYLSVLGSFMKKAKKYIYPFIFSICFFLTYIILVIALEIVLPSGDYAGLAYARSGLACKKDLAPANKVGVIDSDYRGEFMIALHNHGGEVRVVEHGERIAQLVITPVFTPGFTEVLELSNTERGSGGFGSTGK